MKNFPVGNKYRFPASRGREEIAMTNPETFSDLQKVIEILKSQNAESALIESVEAGRNAILAFEMMGIMAQQEEK